MKSIRPALIVILIFMFVKDFYLKPTPDVPAENIYIKLLDLQKPSDNVIDKATPVEKSMGKDADIEHKELIGIFHNEMAKRLPKYQNVSTVQFENYYLDSAREVYGDKIRGKYSGLGDAIQNLVINSLGEDEGIITTQEMNNLSDNMKGISWVLLGNMSE